jgi:hypothetical protein
MDGLSPLVDKLRLYGGKRGSAQRVAPAFGRFGKLSGEAR